MSRQPAAGTRETWLGPHARLVEQLYAASGAVRWRLAPARFAEALCRSVARRFTDAAAAPAAAQVAGYLESLHVEDLALACACSEGSEPAWEEFLAVYRTELYRAARAITGASGGEARAEELADSLLADLYGISAGGAEAGAAGRKPLFNYFHGRSRLSTWLRTVLAQRNVDAIRAERRIEPLEPAAEPVRRGSPERVEPPDPDRARYLELFEAALARALGALKPRDLLRLSLYYARERTLAEVGRILGEHEATVSRNLERTRRELRERVERSLAAGSAADGAGVVRSALSKEQIRLCFAYALEDWPFDLARTLRHAGGSPGESLADAAREPRRGAKVGQE